MKTIQGVKIMKTYRYEDVRAYVNRQSDPLEKIRALEQAFLSVGWNEGMIKDRYTCHCLAAFPIHRLGGHVRAFEDCRNCKGTGVPPNQNDCDGFCRYCFGREGRNNQYEVEQVEPTK